MRSLLKSVVIAVLAMLTVPIAAFVLATHNKTDLDDRFMKAASRNNGLVAAQLRSQGVSYETFCAADVQHQYGQVCGPLNEVHYFEWAALAACALGILALGLAVFVPVATGHSRRWLALAFSPTVRVVTFAVGISFCLQAALATYGLYLLESQAVGRVHIQIIGAVGIGGLIAGVLVLKSTFSIFRPHPMLIVGERLNTEKEAAFFGRLRELAAKTGAAVPSNVVVGLEPNFFVTSAPVQLVGEPQPLPGNTLYLSAPLCRLFTAAELDAVVGHEFGHFSGEDTLYSMRFAPAYRTLHDALLAVHRQASRGGLISAMAIPARSMLDFCLSQFARPERRISREREHAADEVGASIAGPMPLATALLKVGLYVPMWRPTVGTAIKVLDEGKAFRNLSETYAQISIEHGGKDAAAQIKAVAGQAMAHPTDTHPSTRERIAALKLDLDSIPVDQVALAAAGSSALSLGALTEIEEGLSQTYQNVLIVSGQATPPKPAAA
ncbi:MAG: M48 family metalloprotease [Reyranella sp.]|uniref:M48 family metallopeptidase n=1 Tax=Reyranella sp. TaxID=1929291 RepID=UPI001AC7F3EE|nr:M48 family metallopeptidase [Reyranella sp.]MBN9091385.1 M48 family metalloprotease [Reyranella sp.]